MVKTTAPTLKDIAKVAGVSAMAVSVALRGGDQGVRLSSSTRERIQRIAADLGYQVNVVARALSKRKTDTIGLLSGGQQFNADSPFSAVILHGLQLGCADHQRDMLLYRGSLESDGAGVAYRSLADGKVDGAILLNDRQVGTIAGLDHRRLPLVSIGSNRIGIPFIGCNEQQAARLLCQHLYQRGHRRVLWRRQAEPPTTQQERFDGFLNMARELGMTVEDSVLDYARPALSPSEVEKLRPGKTGRATACVGFADHAVHPVLTDMQSRGWRISEDVAVAGFDGLDLFMESAPRRILTTMCIPWRQIARDAVGTVVAQIEGRPIVESTLHEATLRIGDTT